MGNLAHSERLVIYIIDFIDLTGPDDMTSGPFTRLIIMNEQTDFKLPYDPDEELKRLLKQDIDDRDTDPKSDHRIWTTTHRTVSMCGFDYSEFIEGIREEMDGIRAEYPHMNLNDDDFRLSTDVGWCYEDSFGELSIQADVVEREDQWIGRLRNNTENEKRELEQLKMLSDKLGYKIEKK